jgi:hypothetical protein
MRHLATFSSSNFERNPFHVECSCGVAGDFASQSEAHDWMQYKHFAKLSGIAYGEFSSAPTPSEPTPQTASASEGQKKSQPATSLQTETLGDA